LLVAAPVCGQTPPGLEGLRRALQQPGPEARLAREAAIEALLSRKDPAAHALLQAVVRGGADADGVAFTVLSQLRRKLVNPHDPVFANGERDRSVGGSYVPALAAVFAAGPESSQAERDLREEARQCLSALSPADRRRAIESLLETDDLELRRGALLLAGDSRDLGLAPLLAGWLDVAEAADTAREALSRLTFVEAFASRQQFEEWWTANRERSYLLLAEEAARRVRDIRTAALRRAEQRTTEAVAELVEALATRDDIAWGRIADRVMADEPAGSMRVCLERLRDVLAKAPRHGGAAADRLAFLQKLLRQLQAGGAGPDGRAVLLEVCAYLVAPGEEKPAEELLALLRDSLQQESAAMRRAAALGLGRFPSPAATKLLVEAAGRARAAGETSVLGAALAALAAPGRCAPDAEPDTLAAWLALVDGILRDEAAPEPVREAALSVLEQKGAQGKLLPQAFATLIAVAQNAGQVPFIRERAAVLLLPHATADAGHAATYVATALDLLDDPEKRMRLKAAQLLQNLPKHRPGADQWRSDVLAGAGGRLAQEPDEAVLRALITCVERQVDPDKPDLEPVISRLCSALQDIAQAGVTGTRRQILVSALAGQAATQGLDTMKWVRAAETLVALGERRELRNVIERQRPLLIIGRDGVNDEVVRRALEMVVHTALLKPRGEPWSKREAGEVLEALQHFESRRVAIDAPDWRLLRIEALAAAERWDEVLQRGQVEIEEGKLPPGELTRVHVATARAHLARNDVDAAIKIADGELAGAEPASTAALAEETGVVLLRAGRFKDALTWLVRAQQQTAETDPLFPRRFLRRLDAEAQAEPETRSTVLARLMAREQLFVAPEVQPDLRAEFEQLKQRLSGKL
jgi:hypothetical protein